MLPYLYLPIHMRCMMTKSRFRKNLPRSDSQGFDVEFKVSRSVCKDRMELLVRSCSLGTSIGAQLYSGVRRFHFVPEILSPIKSHGHVAASLCRRI